MHITHKQLLIPVSFIRTLLSKQGPSGYRGLANFIVVLITKRKKNATSKKGTCQDIEFSIKAWGHKLSLWRRILHLPTLLGTYSNRLQNEHMCIHALQAYITPPQWLSWDKEDSTSIKHVVTFETQFRVSKTEALQSIFHYPFKWGLTTEKNFLVCIKY